MYRWAMAGVAGALGAELLGQGDWYEAPKWVSALLGCCAHHNHVTTMPACPHAASRNCLEDHSPSVCTFACTCTSHQQNLPATRPYPVGHSSGDQSCMVQASRAECCSLQAITGGQPQYLGIPLPFSLGTLLAIVSAPLQLSHSSANALVSSPHTLLNRRPCRTADAKET